MEATYTPGDGIVVGAGPRWLLASPDPGPDTADRLWVLLTGPRPDAAEVLDAVISLCSPDADLVLVDLTVGAETSVTRGRGRHTTLDGVHTLTVEASGAEPDAVVRRLVGGVVGASRLVLRPAPVRAPAPAVVTAPAAPVAPPVAGLIDAVPPEILAASAPPPPPRPLSPVPVQTDEPPPESRRVVERVGNTVRRDLGGPPGDGADHDGHTTYRPQGAGPTAPPPPGPPPHLQQATNETVLAVHCPAGHVTAAYSPRCRVCHEPVPPQEPHRMPRPRLGTLHLPDGERVPLDRGVVFGRQPEPTPGGAEWPHLVRLPPEATYVSRSHLSVVLDGWLVIATDLGSRGGTTLRVPGRPAQRIRGHEQYVWEPGQVLDLADCYEVVYEVTA
ncbi:MAG: hypothetical protein JWN84_3143 [Nocardioides sp.]|nr:hypothetical protein [Nocardioides sp.]